jgi:hypothetical protein
MKNLKLSKLLKMKLIIFLFFHSTFSNASLTNVVFDLTCRVLLESVHAKSSDFNRDFSVRIEPNSKNGHNGGQIYTVKRKSIQIPWLSDASSHHAALQGDPRWFINTFGNKGAETFGFKQIDDLTLEIPDAIEISRSIDLINERMSHQRLAQPIAIHFYPSPQERVPVDEYLTRWAQEGSLPLAERHMSMIHDTSYHVPSILIPPRLVELSRLQTQYLLDFVKFLRERIPFEKHPPSFENDIFELKMRRLSQIDEGTANTVMHLNEYSMQRKAELLKELGKVAEHGMSPADTLIQYLGITGKFQYIIELEDFFAIHAHDRNFFQGMSQSEIMKVCLEMYTQIQAIRQAANQ